jgi:hypothetical protein
MITRVKDIGLNELVIYDGGVYKVVGFSSRKMVLLRDMEEEDSNARIETRVSIKKIKKPICLENVDVSSLVVKALQHGLRDEGVACKASMVGDEVWIMVSAHRPVPYIKIKFIVPGKIFDKKMVEP